MHRSDNDRVPPAANQGHSNVTDGDASDSTAPADQFCCAALTLEERMTAARFGTLCSVDRCARQVLRGES